VTGPKECRAVQLAVASLAPVRLKDCHQCQICAKRLRRPRGELKHGSKGVVAAGGTVHIAIGQPEEGFRWDLKPLVPSKSYRFVNVPEPVILKIVPRVPLPPKIVTRKEPPSDPSVSAPPTGLARPLR